MLTIETKKFARSQVRLMQDAAHDVAEVAANEYGVADLEEKALYFFEVGTFTLNTDRNFAARFLSTLAKV